jgi:hypothetical protein
MCGEKAICGGGFKSSLPNASVSGNVAGMNQHSQIQRLAKRPSLASRFWSSISDISARDVLGMTAGALAAYLMFGI